jgi:5-methylthioadenosine/S-adenosylhomocysteine deaminase
MSVLFENIAVLTRGTATERRFVAVDGDRIVYVGGERPTGDFTRVYDGRERLLMPGFYNAHAHSPMTLMRGYGENLTLNDWLTKKMFPFEDKLTGDDVYWSTLLAMAESVRYGIVSSTDMYFFCEDMICAIDEAGAKANIGRAIVSGQDDERIEDLVCFREAKDIYERYHEASGGRIRVDMSLHAEYTSTPTIVRQLAEYTAEIGARMHVHVSETTAENEGCKERHGGLTPTAYLNTLGLFDTKTTAAHCVWVDEEDMDILAEKGVTVASCPVSNLKLASGVCDIPALLERGINVAIGTDSVASNNNLNMVEEIKFFALLNKERKGDPTCITPHQTVDAATVVGAESQGRDDCGRIEEGCRADLIVMDLSGSHLHPVHDLYNNLVYAASGSDVTLTMIDGKVVYDDGTWPTIDIERVKAEAGRATRRILGALHE